MSSQNPFVSFIIPVYNEEQNITGVFNDIYNVLQKHPEWHWEFIVIEDGSKDNTKEVILDLVKQYPETQLILHEKNMGWTQSMKDGIARAKGKYLMYIGADEEFDCSEIPSFLEKLTDSEDPADLVLGVRWQRNAYKLHRFFLSVIYIFMLNGMFKLRVNDYNWSQLWSREFMESVTIESKSLFMLPELIIKAYDLGFRVKEVPSNHRGRKWGKSSLNMKIFGHALLDSFKYWFYRRSKKYAPGKKKSRETTATSA